MTQSNSVTVKLSHSQLNKLKLATKNATEVTSSNDETNFPHKL